MNEYAERQGKIISDFLLKKMTKGKPEIILPKNYTISQSISIPEETVEGELIYFFKGCRMTLNFKITGDVFVRELIEELREGKF